MLLLKFADILRPLKQETKKYNLYMKSKITVVLICPNKGANTGQEIVQEEGECKQMWKGSL